MICVRSKNSKVLGNTSFINKTCAYIFLKSQNRTRDFEIVNVKYYCINKNKKLIGPFDTEEARRSFINNQNLDYLKLLNTIKII